MDTLAIPSASQHHGRPQPLRAVRSTGSLRTPHSSHNLNPANNHHGQSLSPPDLSFSRSDLHSDQEPDFMGHRDISGSSSSMGKNDSWKSAYSNASGAGGGAYLSGKQQGKQRVRLDSVFGTQLPGFPYLNSAAAATSGPILSSHPLHGSQYNTHDLRNRSSRTWSDRSASAAGSYSNTGTGSRSKIRTISGSTRTRSDTLGMDSETSGTSAGAQTALTDLGEADTSCSGGSNSSDEVDLDLSFDMDVLRARQQQLQMQARQRALASQARKGKQPQNQQPPHVGIDMQSDGEEEEENTLPNQHNHSSAANYRRYRLGGKQRMSRSAVELRSEAQQNHPGATPQPYFLQEHGQYHRHSHSGRSDPGRLAAPNATTPTTWARQPSMDLSVEIPDDSRVTLGWSFATTPPLSPAELVTFTEQNYPQRYSRSHSDSGTNIGGNGEGRRGSSGASALLRKRRPSFPLMYLLDKAIRGGTHDTPVDDDEDRSPPLRSGAVSRANNNEDLTISSFGFTSPTPTQANMYPEHYRPPSAPLPPLPIMPAALAEQSTGRADSYIQSPTSMTSPNFLSSPETMTADLTPGTSAWNSPRTTTIDGDEIPTPRTGEFDHRFSQYSMSPAMGSEAGGAAGIRGSLKKTIGQEREKEQKRRESQDESAAAAVPYKPSHARQSSSIFRLPFVSNFFNPFRPSSPATTVIPEVADGDTATSPPPPSATPEATSRASTAIPRVQELSQLETSVRAASPTSADSHGPAGSSEESHAPSSTSTPPSPPLAGARPSRLSGVIDDSMLRPGPNTGKGRLAGLGLSFNEQQRQSSLPVLAFSAASSDENHSQDSQHNSDGAVSRSQSRNGHPVRSMQALPHLHPRRSTESAEHQITVIEQNNIRRPSMSAPATTIHFHEADLDIQGLTAGLGPRTASPRMQHHSSTPSTPTIPRRPRTILPKTSDIDLRARLDGMKPAQLLFLAAFVLGPWCFVIGGWGLRNLDGECTSVTGVRCRCPDRAEECECQAEIYRQIRLSGGKYLAQIQSVTALKGGQVGTQQQIRTKQLDKYVLANRIAALLCGTVTLVLGITALIVLARTW